MRAGGSPAVPSLHNPRAAPVLATFCVLLYVARRVGDYHNSHAAVVTGRSPCLDFSSSHVYPEACYSMPQVDRDAVIVFLGD
jgi:hypothetical protein